MNALASKPAIDLAAILERYRRTLEAADRSNFDTVVDLYSERARFEDPLSRVNGKEGVRRALADAWKHVPAGRFEIHERAVTENAAFVRWSFVVDKPLGKRTLIDGIAHLHFDADGRIEKHVDYFDAARAIYRRVPILGRILELLRKRLSAGWEPAP